MKKSYAFLFLLAWPLLSCSNALESKIRMSCISSQLNQKPLAGEVKELQGQLRAANAEVFNGARISKVEKLYHFYTQQGEKIDLSAAAVFLKSVPINENIILKLKNTGGQYLPLSFESVDSLGCLNEKPLRMEAFDEPKEVKIALFFKRYADQRAWDRDEINEKARVVGEYFTSMSRGKLVVTADAHEVVNDFDKYYCRSNVRDCEDSFDEQIGELKRSQKYRLYSHIKDTGTCGGYTYYGHPDSYCSCSSIGIILHELGHTNLFDLHHAGTTNEEDKGYGDYSSIMGGNVGAVQLNSFQMVKLKYYNPKTYKSLTQTEKLFLAPLENLSDSISSSVYQIISVHGDQFVSYRASGFEYSPLDSSHQNVVQLHSKKRDDLLYDADNVLIANLKPGESVIKNNVKVHFIGMRGDFAEVDIYYNINDAQPGDLPDPVLDCEDGYDLVGDYCLAKIEVRLSKTRPNGPKAKNFKKRSDTLYWRVLNIGYNGKYCIQYSLTGANADQSNWGYCESISLDDYQFMSRAKNANSKWYWNEQHQVFALKQRLSRADEYKPGVYKFYWYNPDTGQRETNQIKIQP